MARISNSQNIEVVELDETKNTNLHLLAMNGDHLELAKFKAFDKIDARNTFGVTPLMCAVRNGHLDAVKVLLDLRADASKMNKYGGSVFLMAVASGNLDVVTILLHHLLSGGVSRQVIESQISPIALSILFDHEDVFRLLIGSNFNVQARSFNTNLTPLMFAALNENQLFLNQLLLLGADARVRSANNETCNDLKKFKEESTNSQQHQPNPANRKLRIKIPPHHQLQQHQTKSPVIIVRSPSLSKCNPLLRLSRKSSDTCSPDAITPAISPVGYYPQVFFPADLIPSQFASPTYFISRCDSPFQNFVISPFHSDDVFFI
ncbi:ankyrin repeat and KH domain-containing protein 1-like isoform X3 [Atheta coriaria]|uniref:ankyrin repeat and KH domain-containing protein 1-like isoform X3 n=2 Tax=Dalotia coriaria TaxID=877792 RepID=UPI0031F4562B